MRKLLGWATPLPLVISNLLMKVVGFPVVLVAAVFAREDDTGAWHFPRWAWLWDNHHDRMSNGIDGRDAHERRWWWLRPRYLRQVYWAGFRNAASNYGKLVLGYHEDTFELFSWDYRRPGYFELGTKAPATWPSDRKRRPGRTIAYARTNTGRVLPMFYLIHPWTKTKCLRITYGYALWEDDAHTGDTDDDWAGLQINFSPWKSYGN